MIENPVEGNEYWSLRRSVESEGYLSGWDRPRKPWKGWLKEQQRAGGVARLLIQGNALWRDVDSNSYACVELGDLFLTEADAMAEYGSELARYMQRLCEELGEVMQIMHKLSGNFVSG